MIKIILVIIASVMLTLGVYFSASIFQDIFSALMENPIWIIVISIAVLVQLVGHLYRVKRTKLVLDQAAPSSIKFQFGALSIGYLFNALLPLRIGELIRALLIARRLQISLLYTFASIVIERATDILFLSLVVVTGSLIIGGEDAIKLALIGVTAGILSILIIAVLILLKQENKFLLSLTSKLSNLFNSSIGNSIRFKTWSLIFGLQNFFGNKKFVKQYIQYAVVSWVCYFISTSLVVVSLLAVDDVTQAIIATVSPYIITLPTHLPLDVDSYLEMIRLLPASMGNGNLDIYAKIIWLILILPMSIIGFVALLSFKIKKSEDRQSKLDPVAYENKLLRRSDISQDFPAFLDTYFEGNSLSRILHRIEVSGEVSLVKFFKGGSDAITVLALKNGHLFVKKIVAAEHADRLRVQYKWLKRYATKKAIVDVLAEQKTDDYYSIDLSYDPANISLFEYIHTHSLNQAKQALDDVWNYVFKNIYALKKESVNSKERDEYVQERLIDKIQKAVMANEDLKEAISAGKIIINGEKFDNFSVIFEKIKSHKQAWNDIATYRKSQAIHGDLTVDNILINTLSNTPVIIDPSDDNQIRGPIIDLARHTQSLIAGYEFLNNDDEPTKATKEDGLLSINYHAHRSARYMELYEYLNNTIAPKYFTETERKTVLFHTGLLYGRMLAHRVVINPHNTLKYYAVCVVLMNEFYRQYDN
jgi:hypothetical protein